jgi:hypothetical protein
MEGIVFFKTNKQTSKQKRQERLRISLMVECLPRKYNSAFDREREGRR